MIDVSVHKPRFTKETLRRAWARKYYEPSTSTYLHDTDEGYLEYDLWEHTDNPPQGHRFGLITRKVTLPIESMEKEFIAAHDRHSWIGIPVSVNSDKESLLWKEAKRSDQVKQMYLTSPYTKQLFRRDKAAWIQSKLTNPNNSKPSTSSSSQKNIQSTEETKFTSQDIDKQLAKLNYDFKQEEEFRLPGRPPIGTHRYHPFTGHLLVYKGNNIWKRVHDNEIVNYDLNKFNDKLPVESITSLTTEVKDLIRQLPSIKESRTGYITVQNNKLSTTSLPVLTPSTPFTPASSSFLTSHQQDFQTQYQVSSDRLQNSLDLSHFQLSKEGNPIRGGKKYPMYSIDPNKPDMWKSVRDGLLSQQSEFSNLPVVRNMVYGSETGENDEEEQHSLSTYPSYDLISSIPLLQSIEEIETNDIQDYESVWKRSVFVPKKKIVSKVVVWPKKTPGHYSFKYSWIPQPLVHNAVNSHYYTKSKDRTHSTTTLSRPQSPENASQLLPKTESYQLSQTQQSMYHLVTNSLVDNEESEFESPSISPVLSPSRSIKPTASRSNVLHRSSHDNGGWLQSEEAMDDNRTFLSSLSAWDQITEGQTRSQGKVITSIDELDEENRSQYSKSKLDSFSIPESRGYQQYSQFDSESGVGSRQEQANNISLFDSMELYQPSKSFEEFVTIMKPGEISKQKPVLTSTHTTAGVRNHKETRRKFAYRPPIFRKDAKINPVHDYEWR